MNRSPADPESSPHPQAISSDSTTSEPRESRGVPAASLKVKLLVLGLSIAFSAAMLEIGLRLVGRGPLAASAETRGGAATSSDPDIARAQQAGWVPSATDGERLSPFREAPEGFLTFHRDAHGLRGTRQTELTRRVDERRVLVLGDSHAEGMVADDQTFAAILERQLNESELEAGSTTWTVLNGAFRRASPLQEYWAWRQAYHKLDAQTVVVTLFIGNDLIDLLRASDRIHLQRDAASGWQVVEPKVASNATEDRPSWIERLKQPLRRHSAIYRNLTEIPWLRQAVVESTSSEYRIRLEQAASREPGWVWQAANQLVYFDHHPEEQAAAIEQLIWIAQRWQTEARERNVRLVFVLLPAGMQVQRELWQEQREQVAQWLDLDATAWDALDSTYDVVLQQFAKLEMPLLDVREAMRAAIDSSPVDSQQNARVYYYEFDQHLNPAGHQFVADLLERWLLELVD